MNNTKSNRKWSARVEDSYGQPWEFDPEEPFRNIWLLVENLDYLEPWIILDMVDAVMEQQAEVSGLSKEEYKWTDSSISMAYSMGELSPPPTWNPYPRAHLVDVETALWTGTVQLKKIVREHARNFLECLGKGERAEAARSLTVVLSGIYWLNLRNEDVKYLLSGISSGS